MPASVMTGIYKNTHSAQSSRDKNLSVLYLNARSLKSVNTTRNKLHQFHNAINLGNYDIIAVTETWLNSSVLDSKLVPPGYTVYRRDREDVIGGKVGGGVALFIKDSIFSCRRKDLEPSSEEVVICELRPKKHSKVGRILVYRPPSADEAIFTQNIESVLKSAQSHFDSLCILGDFNLPTIDWTSYSSNSDKCNAFCNIITEGNIIQCNSSNKQGNLLDLVLINSPLLVSEPVECDVDFDTDHTILIFQLHIDVKVRRKIARSVYNFKQTNFDILRSHIAQSQLDSIISNLSDVHVAWSVWNDTVRRVIDDSVPKVYVKDSSSPPWIDGEVNNRSTYSIACGCSLCRG